MKLGFSAKRNLCATIALSLAIAPSTFAQNSADDQIIFLDQGWSEDQRLYYYHKTQGSAMLPLAFYQNIEQADSEALFSETSNIQRLGLGIGNVDEKHNPEGLPIGLALAVVDEGIFKGEWVGFTCSSCHNGELYYEGKTVRIDGGSNHVFSMPHFASELRDATRSTMTDNAKLERLLDRAAGEIDLSKDDMLKELAEISKYLDYFVDRVAGSPHDFGPGRMDAVNQIPNTINAVYPNVPENVKMTNAPTKSPFVWNSPQSAWVQWSGILHRPITRNLGESLGAMVRVNIDPEKGEMYESTVDLRGQFNLERDIRELSPPLWPEDIFGEIDRDLAAKGKELVAENCAACHTNFPYRWSGERLKGKRFVENALVPGDYIGTDPMQFHSATVDPLPNYFTGLLQDKMPNKAFAASTGDIQAVLKQGVIDKYVAELGLTEDEWLSWHNYSSPDSIDEEGAPTVASYKAAPLEGMWATPPFLHNGSVPTLYDLLLPASERAETWTQGREFDPKKVGLETDGETGDYVFDTRLVGMSDSGHSFEDAPLGNGVIGRALSDDERWAIIEYLKTLPETTGQHATYGGPENPVKAWESDIFFNNVNPSGYYHGEGEAPKASGEVNEKAEVDNSMKEGDSAGLGQEVIEENEAQNIERIRKVVLERMKQTYSDGETTKRDAHPKSHGMVKARFIIEKDLPDHLRQGVFAQETEYDALVRFSASTQMVLPDLVQQPHGMAIKLIGVPGAKLLEGQEDAVTQDFVMINAPIFFLADLESYADLFEAQMEGGEALTSFAEKHPDVIQNVGRMISVGGDMNNVFAVQYWSQTPYKFGPHTVKYSARPLSGATNDRPDVTLLEYLRDTMVKTIAENEVRFEFVVQLQKDPKKQPLEDPTVEWNPSETEEIRVATLVIPMQDISSGKDLEVTEDLSFAVWHTIEEHRPLGAVNRARRPVYKAGAELRREENSVTARSEPVEMPDF